MKPKRAVLCAFAALGCVGAGACGTVSEPEPSAPPHQPPLDSIVLIDEGHHNFHTASERYAPFASLLRGSGYTVRPARGTIRRSALDSASVLVIANALNAANTDDWFRPIHPAFTATEILTIEGWVRDGGGLLLIADHMPFPAATAELAAAFGATFHDGFAFDTLRLELPRTCLSPDEVHVFRRSDGSLRDHAVTGQGGAPPVDSVATFTGQAFEVAEPLQPILVFGASAISLLPDTAWSFHSGTPRHSADGHVQGAAGLFGDGRVALFGEAAMFTTQTCGGGTPMGMNSPLAGQNGRLAINTINWLAK